MISGEPEVWDKARWVAEGFDPASFDSADRDADGLVRPDEMLEYRARQLLVQDPPAELQLTVSDGVALISLGGPHADGAAAEWGTKLCEHRLNPAAIAGLSRALDLAEADPAVSAVVVGAEGKFWCNGFDLKWIQQHRQGDVLQRAAELLCAKLLQFPLPTVACLNGHTTAAGAMLALSFDERVMNSQRGFMFVPGVDLGLAYSPGGSPEAARGRGSGRHDGANAVQAAPAAAH